MLHGVTEGHAIQKDVPRWKYIRQLCLFLGMGLFPVLHSHWILCLHLIWTSGCKMQKKPWACFLLPVNGNLAFKKALIAFLFKFRSSTALAICFVLAWVSLTKSSPSTRLQPPGTSPLDVTSGPIHQILRGKKKKNHTFLISTFKNHYKSTPPASKFTPHWCLGKLRQSQALWLPKPGDIFALYFRKQLMAVSSGSQLSDLVQLFSYSVNDIFYWKWRGK